MSGKRLNQTSSEVPLPMPSRRQVLIAGGLAGTGLAVAGLLNGYGRAGLVTGERRGIAFGTVVSIKAVHADEQTLNRGLDAAWAEISEVEAAASLYRETSALSVLNRTGDLAAPPARLIEMVSDACRISQLTDGAFDVTVQPVWMLYAKAHSEGRSARPDELDAARALIGWRGIEVSPDRIRLSRPGMALTLNGIAQGYATGRCLNALSDHGVTDAFLNTGEIGVTGQPAGRPSWTAGIADPRQKDAVFALNGPLNGILATSGDYATTWSADFTHHHILDPKTLRSPPETASVSVLSPSGAMADGLATAFMVMGADKALALAARLEGVEALIVAKDATRRQTAGFPAVA